MMGVHDSVTATIPMVAPMIIIMYAQPMSQSPRVKELASGPQRSGCWTVSLLMPDGKRIIAITHRRTERCIHEHEVST